MDPNYSNGETLVIFNRRQAMTIKPDVVVSSRARFFIFHEGGHWGFQTKGEAMDFRDYLVTEGLL